MRRVFIVIAALLMIAGIALSGDSTKTETPSKPEQKAEAAADSCEKGKKLEFVTTESGLKYADLVVGEGKEAAEGMQVECHYTLWVADEKGEKGKMVQSSKEMGKTFPFKVGASNLIKGWNEGMLGMKEGGARMLIIPPELGYGDRPPQEGKNLIFEIEFIKAL